MQYILLDFGTFRAYQEIVDGHVQRYVYEDGSFAFDIPPTGNGGAVIDADPPRQVWML
jgi:hypothetical protein